MVGIRQEQGFQYQWVKKAMRIRRKHETLESCQHLTVEEALGYDEAAVLSQEYDADEAAMEMALVGALGRLKPQSRKNLLSARRKRRPPLPKVRM